MRSASVSMSRIWTALIRPTADVPTAILAHSREAATPLAAARPYLAGNLEKRLPYDPEMIDRFFIMDVMPAD